MFEFVYVCEYVSSGLGIYLWSYCVFVWQPNHGRGEWKIQITGWWNLFISRINGKICLNSRFYGTDLRISRITERSYFTDSRKKLNEFTDSRMKKGRISKSRDPLPLPHNCRHTDLLHSWSFFLYLYKNRIAKKSLHRALCIRFNMWTLGFAWKLVFLPYLYRVLPDRQEESGEKVSDKWIIAVEN